MQKLEGLLKEGETFSPPATIEAGLRQAQGYMEMVQLYNSAIREITTKLEILDSEFRLRYDHNPIHHIDSRLKSIASIVEKLRRKGEPVNIQSARERLTDIAGVRVVCNYIDDIYRIADVLSAQDDVAVLRRTDYIEAPKENGYRSLHLVVSVPVFLSGGSVPVPVEVQIRTIAMDFWASVEHKVRYKKNIPDSEAEQLAAELSSCADQIAAMDNKMEEIRRRIAEAEEREAENSPAKQPQTIGGVMLKKRLESGRFPFKK